MLKIDAHQHFWNFDPVRDSWIDDSMSILQTDFLPKDLAPILEHYAIDGCVSVQADQSEAQNDFLLGHAGENELIKGVVGWVDLQAEDVEDRLAYYAQFGKMKGFRHVLQGEADRAFMLRPQFKRGINMLNKFGFTYDILIFPDQLEYTLEFVRTFPDQPFVIDHIAKPPVKDGHIDDWKKQMEAIAKHQNVYCKLSGMVTEADWMNWKLDDFKPYMDVVFGAFGCNRIMYGSDWPVCRVAATYGAMMGIAEDYVSSFSAEEQADFWGNTATEFYKLT